MARSVLVVGEPGTGKSRAILNLDPTTTLIVRPNRKDLPFKGGASKYSEEKKNLYQAETFGDIDTALTAANKSSRIKTVIIEDLTHFFSNRVMKDAKNKGFDKWTDLAQDVFNALIKKEKEMRDDLCVIIVAHTMASSDLEGNRVITLQTPGKLLENNIKIPSYFTYVLHTDMKEENGVMKYRFLTNSDGVRLAKSPEGCFDLYEPNDYKLIIDKIEAYQKGE